MHSAVYVFQCHPLFGGEIIDRLLFHIFTPILLCSYWPDLLENISRKRHTRSRVQVFQVRDDAGTIYALKTIKCPDQSKLESAETEIKLLSSLNHPNVVRMYSHFKIDHEPMNASVKSPCPIYCVVMEFCGTSLDSILSKTVVPTDVLLSWFIQLADALKYIHERKIIHRDLKVCFPILRS